APRDLLRQRLRWIALAFVPSSLMMGVTTALTTDVPAIPLFWVLPLAFYLLTLFAIALVCHGELARSRPKITRLTEFYLWISFGGVLGGIFNALIAPVIFNSVIEFPLVLVLAALLRPPIDVKENTQRARRLDFLLPVILGLSLLG